MEWLRGGLAAIVTTAISFGALSLYFRRQKRREEQNPNNKDNERRRAEKIVSSIGTAALQLFQLAGGMAAGISMFALLIFIGSGSNLPKIEDVVIFASLFFGGWIIFAWCLRITDALEDKK